MRKIQVFFFCCRYFILKYRTSSKVQWKTSRANNNSRCWRCVSYTRALHMDGKSTTSSWNWNHNVRNVTHKKLQHSQYIVCMEKTLKITRWIINELPRIQKTSYVKSDVLIGIKYLKCHLNITFQLPSELSI